MKRPEEDAFSATEVVEALGMSRTVFDAWMQRGHLGLSRGPGIGRARSLTFEEVVKVAAIKELTEHGIPVAKAGEFLKSVETAFSEAFASNYASDRILVISNDGAHLGHENTPWEATAIIAGSDVFTILRLRTFAPKIYNALRAVRGELPVRKAPTAKAKRAPKRRN